MVMKTVNDVVLAIPFSPGAGLGFFGSFIS
jgi:hypothetical protein